MDAYQQKARELRVRAYEAKLDHGVSIKALAKDLDYHRAYVSQVLGGHLVSQTALRRIEEYLDNLPMAA